MRRVTLEKRYVVHVYDDYSLHQVLSHKIYLFHE